MSKHDDAATLAQGATARPWATGSMDVPEDIEPGPIAPCWIIKADGSGYDVGFVHDEADGPFLVYAVNHIEQAEADLRTATELLEGAAMEAHTSRWDIHTTRAFAKCEQYPCRDARVFLRRHAAPPDDVKVGVTP